MAATFDGGLSSNFKSTGEKFLKNRYRRFTGVSLIFGYLNLKIRLMLSSFLNSALLPSQASYRR